MSGLREDNWENEKKERRQLDCPVFLHSVYCNMMFWLKCMRESWPHTDRGVTGKGRTILMAFSDNCRFSSDTRSKLSMWHFRS